MGTQCSKTARSRDSPVAVSKVQGESGDDKSGRLDHAASPSEPTGEPSSKDIQHTPSPSERPTETGTRVGDGKKTRTIAACRLKKDKNVWDIYEQTSKILGTGISGYVRTVRNKESGIEYAMKTLNLTNISPKKATQLHNEVAVYLRLDHPNIAKLIEVYEDDCAIHVIMELCSGKELYDRLAAKKRFTEADASKVARQMLSAVTYCHRHSICHRDLKLENWVYGDMSEDSPLKLLDFGFSRMFNPHVPMTAMHGTVYYVSPEVMDGCYGEKCDIWSLGVIVFMLLSGHPPFNGPTDHEILVKIRRGHFSFSGMRWDGISSAAKSFVSLLLSRDPKDRPSAEQALQHGWLRGGSEGEIALDLAVLAEIRRYAVTPPFKRAVLALVALSVNNRQVDDLETQFKILDRGSKGTLDLVDLKLALEQYDVSDEEAGKIFSILDQRSSREVHFSEFVAGALQPKLVKSTELLKQAFLIFDTDRSGYITSQNLSEVLGDEFDGKSVEDLMHPLSVKKPGFIDFEEFTSVLNRLDTCEKGS